MGGVEGASCTLVNNLTASGNDVTYMALMDFTPFFMLDERAHYVKPHFNNLPKMSFFKTIFWIRYQIELLQPESIIVFTKYYSALANVALLFTPFKIIVTERSSPTYKWPKHISIFSKISFFLKNPIGIIAQTETAKRIQQKYYGNTVPIVVIPNAVRPLHINKNVIKENFIVAVGRFNDPCKGFDLLLMAFSKIKNSTWKLKFIGGEKNEGGLYQMAEVLNISSRVEFTGKIKHIDECLSTAGLFVMPSRSEGFPNALVEAMAAGLPCISFDFIAGARDIITHDFDGILVNAEDVNGLALAIDDLIENPIKRMKLSENALKIKDRLNPNKITEMTENFLRELLN